MALGLAARAKTPVPKLFKDIRACGTDDEGPARRHATRHVQFVVWSSLFEQRWSISGGRRGDMVQGSAIWSTDEAMAVFESGQ